MNLKSYGIKYANLSHPHEIMQMSYRVDKKVIFCKYTDIVIWNGIKLYLSVSTLAENKGTHHRTSVKTWYTESGTGFLSVFKYPYKW